MMQLGALGFASPWLLLGLLVLPVLWWLLRATPPAPVREKFPGIVVLLGLRPEEKTPERTPWWLLLLRIVVAGLAILAFAQPLLNPRDATLGSGPVRLVVDGGWASAPDWNDRIAEALAVLDRADRSGRAVAVHVLAQPEAEPGPEEAVSAREARGRIAALEPSPWQPNRAAFLDRLESPREDIGETVWVHDGLDHGGQFAEVAERLASLGALRLIGPAALPRVVKPVAPDGERLVASVERATSGAELELKIVGYSAEEDATRKAIALATASFDVESQVAEAVFDAPLELRNRIALFGLDGARHAGATALIDERWRRKRVGMVSGERPEDGQRLLSGAHYVRKALTGRAELREGTIAEVLAANVDAIILIDVGSFPEGEAEALREWVEGGGLLVRFAGPALASTAEERRLGFGGGDDPLLPVELRPGGRDLGGAMSWGEPQRISPFLPDTPFFGLQPPEDSRISKQVLAEPDIDLPNKVWASLTDGAPLVTSSRLGDGRLVLFHTSADPRWSTLPLSGLFFQMLDRVLKHGVGVGAPVGDQSGGFWSPVALIGFDGQLRRAAEGAQRIDGGLIGLGGSQAAPPGLYEKIGSGEETGVLRAHNLLSEDAVLTAAPPPPPGAVIETLGERKEIELKPWFLMLALTLLMIDAIAALALAGKLRGAVASAAVAFLCVLAAPTQGHAASADEKALRAALDGALGYVVTGDRRTDELVEAGLFGLTRVLIERTSVEPADPVGVNLETDELAVFPLIYWAVSESQPIPSDEAIARLNEYMRRGGMLLIDTRDQNLSLGNAETPGTRALRRLTAGLDLPPLSPVPEGHVLHRSFYLLDEFPGRWRGGQLWVEAAPPEDIETVAETGGFRNDGVSPIIVGGRDWIGAWAIDQSGRPMLPVGGRGASRQREIAYRFGVNLVMYAYTGSYKSDQVHIPALLQRLGQ